MAIYDIDYCDRYMDELLDKMGSDYFPLPIKFGRFITTTLDFIREHTVYLEASQEISDDIKPLLVRRENVLAPVAGAFGLYRMAEPVDYLRLITIMPYATVGTDKVQKAKKVYVVKEGQRMAYERDPHRRPSPAFPQIFRLENFFEISVGVDTDSYPSGMITYIKKPTFGNQDVLTDRIVNLPDISIQLLMLKTTESLRFTTAEETAKDIYTFDQTFGKRNK